MFSRHLTLAAVLVGALALPFPLAAQGMGMGPGMMGSRGMLPNPALLPALKEKLKITADQEKAWTAYADGITSAAAMRDQMRQSAAEKTVTERIETRSERQAAGAQVHDGLNALRSDLVKVLNADQRAILDQDVPPLPPPPGMTK